MPWERRNSDVQLALLDRIAGTQAAAAEFGTRLRRLRELEAQLAAIDELGDEEERDALQALVDEVSLCHQVGETLAASGQCNATLRSGNRLDKAWWTKWPCRLAMKAA